MATIYSGRIEEIRKFDGPELLAQQIVQMGAIHAIEVLLKIGVTEENANWMLSNAQENMRVIEEIARKKGVLLPIIDTKA